MKKPIDLLIGLGECLTNFGEDARSQQAIARACRANGWFSPAEVRRAVAAIVREMLSPEPLRAWLDRYPVPVAAPRRVLVVMAGNIPLVGFFDLLCVVASGHRCLVKPSAKDRVLTEYMVGLLHEIDPETSVEQTDELSAADAVIATGSDNANRHFRSRYGGTPALLRGSRHSVAVLSGRETSEQLAGLADDIWAYSGLGCRSVSLVFLPEGADLNLRMPEMNVKYRNNYRQTRALMTMSGRPFVDLGAAVAVEQRAFPTSLSQIAYSRYASLAEVERWLAEHDDELQCVVSDTVRHSRLAGFGRAQSPSLTDYPDDRDVMAFLSALN